MSVTILKQAQAIADDLVDWRRHLHAHPELSGQEEQTAGFVAEQLRAMGFAPIERFGDSWGVVADLAVNDQPLVALRADMDALPVTEENNVPYASRTPGVMHACGHDAHTAMLLGAARLLRERQAELKRSVRFIFQPHEEYFPGGAAPMIAAGVLDGVERVFGLHVWSQLASGTLGVCDGPFMASPSDMSITVTGAGGHAALPHECVDPIVAAAGIVVELQSVISRSVCPNDVAVVSVTQFHAGSSFNVIPSEAQIGGTIRTFDRAVRDRICERVETIARQVAAAHGAQAEVKIEHGYPTLVNDTAVMRQAIQSAKHVGFKPDQIETMSPIGGGEDFAYYCQKVPGAFVFLGSGNPDKGTDHPHHHQCFDIDERVLPWGSALLAQFCLDCAGA